MSSVSDTSIYGDAVKDVETLLSGYPSEVVEEATLFVVDTQAIDQLREIEKLLKMEYSQYDDVQEVTGVKRRGRKAVEKFSLETIVKVINFDTPANAYQTFVAETWSQTNDKDKIKDRLDAEFDKHKHRIKKFTKDKLKEKGVSKDIEDDILKNIEKELKKAEKEKEFIETNFNELDVRISSYYERVKYGALRWYVLKKKQKDVNLRKQVPNVLWLQELTEDEKIRTNNELVYFLDGATRAFGDVFYKRISKESSNG